MEYKNPILQEDFSDPDVIKVGDDFFLVASSFNYMPGVPILQSKDMVHFRLINYVYDFLDERYDRVIHGGGSWAPSLRYHDDTFYCLIPMPDDGIYETHTKDIYGKWSEPRLVIPQKGLEDPCPIWINQKCYVAVAFAKSRMGFNSKIGLYEMKEDLSECLSENDEIIYDGQNQNPLIEGPKFNQRNGYIYIMAPAGSVKTGWQVALRSKNIHGPYESKIVLMQKDSPINGPHQGALVEYEKDKWAFYHFQDMGPYGRILHLEPVYWHEDWPICGEVSDVRLSGQPVLSHEMFLPERKEYFIDHDCFFKNEINPCFQTPANKKEGWSTLTKNGMILHCVNSIKELHLQENTYSEKIPYLNFDVRVEFELNLEKERDEAGLFLMGEEYSYLCVVRHDGKNYLEERTGGFSHAEETISSYPIDQKKIVLHLEGRKKNQEDLFYRFGYGRRKSKEIHRAMKGRWVSSRIGFYARGNAGGSAKILSFQIHEK